MSRGFIRKRDLLTFQELGQADDYITRNLIDNTHYWARTRKTNFGTAREIEELSQLRIEQRIVLRLLRKYVLDTDTPNVKKCTNLLMNHVTTQAFLRRFGDDRKKHDAVRLLFTRYVESFLPACGYEISTTDRYKKDGGPEVEGCVVARRTYEDGEEIAFLTGSVVALTPEEENMLASDFSVVNISSKGGAACLMLGPIRFVNHNCEPNAALAGSKNGVKVVAKNKILPGEEITVTYADAYFGKGNKDCRCAACERNKRGFFDEDRFHIPDDVQIHEVSDDEDEDDEQQVIMIESATESSEDENDMDDNVGLSSDSDMDSDTPAFAGHDNVPALNEMSQRSARPNNILNQLSTNLVEKESKSKIVGGRSLRDKTARPSRYKHQNQSILGLYELDNSVDSLEHQNEVASENLKRRAKLRTLHKLYMKGLYTFNPDHLADLDEKAGGVKNFLKDFDQLDSTYDCLNCGLYFKSDEESFPYTEYCPRCFRHQTLYRLAWPDTFVQVGTSSSLEFTKDKPRQSIGELIKHLFRASRLDTSRSMPAPRSQRNSANGKPRRTTTPSKKRRSTNAIVSLLKPHKHDVFDEITTSEGSESSDGAPDLDLPEEDMSTEYVPTQESQSPRALRRLKRTASAERPASKRSRLNSSPPKSLVKTQSSSRSYATPQTSPMKASVSDQADSIISFAHAESDVILEPSSDGFMQNSENAPIDLPDSSEDEEDDDVPDKESYLKSTPKADPKRLREEEQTASRAMSAVRHQRSRANPTISWIPSSPPESITFHKETVTSKEHEKRLQRQHQRTPTRRAEDDSVQKISFHKETVSSREYEKRLQKRHQNAPTRTAEDNSEQRIDFKKSTSVVGRVVSTSLKTSSTTKGPSSSHTPPPTYRSKETSNVAAQKHHGTGPSKGTTPSTSTTTLKTSTAVVSKKSTEKTASSTIKPSSPKISMNAVSMAAPRPTAAPKPKSFEIPKATKSTSMVSLPSTGSTSSAVSAVSTSSVTSTSTSTSTSTASSTVPTKPAAPPTRKPSLTSDKNMKKLRQVAIADAFSRKSTTPKSKVIPMPVDLSLPKSKPDRALQKQGVTVTSAIVILTDDEGDGLEDADGDAAHPIEID